MIILCLFLSGLFVWLLKETDWLRIRLWSCAYQKEVEKWRASLTIDDIISYAFMYMIIRSTYKWLASEFSKQGDIS